jgi:hypothetical protein
VPRERSVSPPRSSNRTCGFPASGFPTGFIAGIRRSVATSVIRVPFHLGIATKPSRRASGLMRCLIGLRQVTNPRPLRQAHQKSGSFPPPALPGFNGTTTLSDSRTDRCHSASLRPLPSSHTGLPRLRDPLSRRAVPTTPVDRSRCICRLLPQTVLPSPFSGQVGVHNFPFEACSGFTRITARRFAPPPKATFVAGLRYSQLPNRTACQLPGQPTIARVGLTPTR